MSTKGQRDGGRPLVTDPATSLRLGRVRQSGTAAELAVRAALTRLGVRVGRSRRRLPGSPDLVNHSAGWCIFVHGCFWHAHRSCPRASVPKRNRAFWAEKLQTNRRRDIKVLRRVRAMGIRAFVVWECELQRQPELVLQKLAAFLGVPAPRRRTSVSN